MAVVAKKAPRGKKKREEPDIPFAVSFSPIGIDACYDKLFTYAEIRARDASASSKSFSRRSVDDISDDAKRALALVKLLPGDVLVAVAGSGTQDDITKMQRVLDMSNTGIKIPNNLSPDAMIGVSSLNYVFQWPSDMMSFTKRTDGVFQLIGSDDNCFLARVFSKHECDTLVVYVEKTDNYEVSVALIGMPDVLPDKMLTAEDREDVMACIDSIYSLNVLKARPMSDPPPLGLATLYDVNSSSTFALEEVRRRRLPGGAQVDYAQHVCRIYMNKDGGGVAAGTVMLNKGMHMQERDPFNIDFRRFANGYLVIIEMTRPGVTTGSVKLVMGWVNPPPAIVTAAHN